MRTASGHECRYRVSDHLMFSVPSGYVVNPTSGRGRAPEAVQPDIQVNAAQAFETAYGLALEHVLTLGSQGRRALVADEASGALDRG